MQLCPPEPASPLSPKPPPWGPRYVVGGGGALVSLSHARTEPGMAWPEVAWGPLRGEWLSTPRPGLCPAPTPSSPAPSGIPSDLSPTAPFAIRRDVSLCGWRSVCGPKAFGTSQRPAWPLDTFGGTALTWLPRASVLTQQHLSRATCLHPHTARKPSLPSLTDPDRPSPPGAPPGTGSPPSSGPLSWEAPLTRSWHLQTS